MSELVEWLLGLSILVVVVGAPLWVLDWDGLPPYGVSNVYVKLCSDTECSGKNIEYMNYQFRADFANQLVVRKSRGILSPLVDCEVFDSDNWSCDGDKMVDGEYADTSNWGPIIRPISKVRWHAERLLNN